MRSVELASLAIQAEGMRMRYQLRRAVIQLAMAVFGAAFLLAAVIVGHAALFVLLDARLPRAGALGCIAGGDLVFAAVLVALAGNSRPGRLEAEAKVLSRTAASQILPTLNWARLTMLLIGWVFKRRSR